MPEAVSIFVLPPNPKVLRTRLRNRSRAEGVVNEREVYRRLSEASKEIENYREYGYILVNDILDRAVAQLGGNRAGRALLPQWRSHCLPVAQGVGGRRGLPADQIRRSGLNLCWRRLESTATPASSNFPLERIPMTIETSFDSNYRKVLVAARRARQLQSGSHAWSPASPPRPAALRRKRLKPARSPTSRRKSR